uniref:Desulforedoxin domain containing protein n=1 Tax=Bacillus phage KoopaTroopa TaxID=3234046 RepID=A0AB39C7D8_9CAUD
MVAKTYICNHCQLITEPITYKPKCKCGKEMIEGTDE